MLLCKRKLTGQAFGRAAIMRALNEANLGKKADGEIDRPEKPQRPEPALGLGIRDRLLATRDEDEYDDERLTRRDRLTPSVNATVSAPIFAQSRTIDDTILALARTVVAASPSTRRGVLKDACSALTRGYTLEESIRLAEDLDAAIQRIDGVPRTTLERVRARAGR